MVLLKFKSELPPPVVLPSAELSQLVKTNLHYPETYTHPFVLDRWGTHTRMCTHTHTHTHTHTDVNTSKINSHIDFFCM